MLDISNTAQEVMAEWHREKPVLALMGEFSAGKSTLTNALIDRELIPTKVTATQLPAVWLTFAETETLEGLSPNGDLEPLTLDDLDDEVRAKYVLLRYGINAEILRETDIIDAPGISDPRLQKGATQYLGTYLDFVMWCSSATQAWRQSEKKNWTNFPPSLRRHSAILLTRKDKLRRNSDISRVVNRVSRDTKDLFGHVIAIDTLTINGLKHQDDRDAEDWDQSGGAALFAFLEKAIKSAGKRVAAQKTDAPKAKTPKSEAAKTEAPKAADTPNPAAKDDTPKKASQQETSAPKAGAGAAVSKTAEAIAVSTKIDFSEVYAIEMKDMSEKNDIDQLKTKLSQLTDKLHSYKDITPTERFVLTQCLTVGEGRQVNVERLLLQVQQEIADFTSDNWCTLSPAA